MGMSSLVDGIKAVGVRLALRYLDRNPDRNIPRIVDILAKWGDPEHIAPRARAVRAMLDGPENNWYQLIRSCWRDIDDGVRRKLFTNFAINSALVGLKRQDEARRKHGCNVPWAIFDPTSRNPTAGCWAADGAKPTWTRDAGQHHPARQGAGRTSSIPGGEPLVRNDIISYASPPIACSWPSLTHLIDVKVSRAISVEGWDGTTAARRRHLSGRRGRNEDSARPEAALRRVVLLH